MIVSIPPFVDIDRGWVVVNVDNIIITSKRDSSEYVFVESFIDFIHYCTSFLSLRCVELKSEHLTANKVSWISCMSAGCQNVACMCKPRSERELRVSRTFLGWFVICANLRSIVGFARGGFMFRLTRQVPDYYEVHHMWPTFHNFNQLWNQLKSQHKEYRAVWERLWFVCGSGLQIQRFLEYTKDESK